MEAPDAVGPALAFATAVDALRTACVSQRWRWASETPAAWRGVRLTARLKRDCILGDGFDDDALRREEQVNSLSIMDDTLLRSFVGKMQRVSQTHALACVPPPGGASSQLVESPLHLKRMAFGKKCFWFLLYNTDVFGWFHREHTNLVPCGFKVWAPCPLLCRWFADPYLGGAGGLAQQSVLELGAGIGIFGVSLAARAKRVVITDIDPGILRAVRVNVQVNAARNVAVVRFGYGREAATKLRAEHGSFDRVVGNDIVYGMQSIGPIFDSVDVLLSEGGVFSLGFVDRSDEFLPAIRAAAKELGLEQIGQSISLEAALGGAPVAAPSPAAGRRMTGVLAEFQEQLKRAEAQPGVLREAAERVQLLEFRRGAPARRFDVHAMD